MNVNPIDLQVLYSKASEVASALGRGDSAKEAAQYAAADQLTKQSIDSPEVVHTLNPSEQEGNRIGDNPSQKNAKGEKKERHPGENPEDAEGHEEKRAMLDEKVGKIIDIIE
ncbi:MAG: hypothetical protein A2Y33_08505 [Spirochaetes bacterium GWF1_51_8]|nr:MAG: hypothetical protein A2Y33_08505 [Spirochaetes bacterium GWF1_51_8]